MVIDTVQGNHVMVRSGEAAMWPRVPWRTRTRRRIGGSAGRPEVMFDVIWDLALDSLGRIYAIDASRTVRVFDTSGTLLRTIGRPGQGPGEISAGIGVEVAPNGRLWVADPGAGRYTVFDTAGRYDTMISRPLFGGAPVSWRGRFVQDGSLLDEDLSFDSGSPTDIVLHLTPSTGRFDSVAILARSIKEFVVAGHSFPRAPIPYAPYATWRADPSGCFWTGYSDRYRITKVCHGDSVLTVERDWHPVVVTSGERDSALARLEWFTRAGGTIDGGRVPGEKPAFVAFWVDATGYLWVRPGVRRDQEGRVLDVFAPTGAYLGPVQLDFTLSRSRGPGIDPPLIVVGPLLVTTTTDSDGVNLIVVADILDRE